MEQINPNPNVAQTPRPPVPPVPEPPRPPEPPQYDMQDYVHKAVAASEVYQQIKKAKIGGIVSIAGFVLVAVAVKYHIYLGAGVAAALAIFVGLMVTKAQSYGSYLKNTYRL